jgi:hypothetical protein
MIRSLSSAYLMTSSSNHDGLCTAIREKISGAMKESVSSKNLFSWKKWHELDMLATKTSDCLLMREKGRNTCLSARKKYISL